jgi:hypothetical protein
VALGRPDRLGPDFRTVLAPAVAAVAWGEGVDDLPVDEGVTVPVAVRLQIDRGLGDARADMLPPRPGPGERVNAELKDWRVLPQPGRRARRRSSDPHDRRGVIELAKAQCSCDPSGD